MAKDDRLYAPFDIGVDEHPKIIGLSDAAFRAFFEGVFYSRRSLSDGFLDRRIVLRKWGKEVADELSTNDPERPSWSAVENGWQIRDFEKHNPTRAEIGQKRAEVSEKRSAAGKKSGEVRRANAEQAANKIEQTANTTATNANPETETETETSQLLLSAADAPDAGTLLPLSWRPNQKHIDMADALHLDKQRTFERFVDHAHRNNRRQKNWNTAFTNWLRKDAEYAQQRQGSPATRALSNAEQSALEFQALYGGNDGPEGSIQALNSGFNDRQP